MDIGRLLIDQRRTADEYRVTEKILAIFQARLEARGMDAADRTKIEAAVAHTRDELQRIAKRMLELDAAVTAANARAAVRS
jgi:hypothetical protein